MELNLNETNREIIKPSSPSPNQNFQLSLIDLSNSPLYVSSIFFYKTENQPPKIISKNLKISLSKTLSRFYPLAGKIEGLCINCNDNGAIFTEAYTNLHLSDFLKSPKTDSIQEFLPSVSPGESPVTWPLVTVKVSFFVSNSGIAVTVCVSHLICDAASMFNFVKEWAVTSKSKSNVDLTSPQFSWTSIYPPPDISFHPPLTNSFNKFQGKCVTERFVFESSKIKELKTKAASESVLIPTRVEAITSLIWKCAIKASRSNINGFPKSSMMIQAMDLRPRIPSIRDAIGNLLTIFFVKKELEIDIEISEIVSEVRKAKEEINEMIKVNLESGIGENLMRITGSFKMELEPDMDLYRMTSWCKKPFYEIDFGLGKPVWVGSSFHSKYKNGVYVLLMDAKDNEGVEVWISLSEEDMSVFVNDEELLAFATLNPPILI